MMVELTERVAAPPTIVWDCLTDADAVRRWFGAHMQFDARPGGGFVETWTDGERTVMTTGEVLCFEPPLRLGLSWRDEDWLAATTVSITLEPAGEATHLRLRHDGWGALGAGAAALAEAHRAGWRAHLRSLCRYAEAVAQHQGGEPV
ncbi:MAG: SRPBCC domain-containing protein [Thiobacillus sp.]|nr:SRPBCC domain-containing protein [Thiobacillus sp.]